MDEVELPHYLIRWQSDLPRVALEERPCEKVTRQCLEVPCLQGYQERRFDLGAGGNLLNPQPCSLPGAPKAGRDVVHAPKEWQLRCQSNALAFRCSLIAVRCSCPRCWREGLPRRSAALSAVARSAQVEARRRTQQLARSMPGARVRVEAYSMCRTRRGWSSVALEEACTRRGRMAITPPRAERQSIGATSLAARSISWSGNTPR